MAGQCGECGNATGIRNGRAGELVCACVPGFQGLLSYVAAGEGCRGFREKPRPPLRLEPPVPPNDEIRYIPLTRGLFAIVDKADYEWLSGFRWHATSGRKAYACFARKDKVIYMHRLIMNPPEGKFVDHVDGNSLNYRRCNLRICNKAQNTWNRPAVGGTSRFKGVHRTKDGRWKAGIRVGGQQTFIGLFDDEIEAAKAYDDKAREFFGEFAYLNFPATGGIVLLKGTIQAHSGTRGKNTVVKRESAPNPKSQTRQLRRRRMPVARCHPGNPKQIQSTKTQSPKQPPMTRWLGSMSLEHLNLDHCFELRYSYFEFPPAGLEGVGPGP
jgi:hypothetical protein